MITSNVIGLPIRILALLFLWMPFTGCSSAKIKAENGFVEHEKLYRLPLFNDASWMKMVPAGDFDAFYMKCPGNQGIQVLYTVLCGKFDFNNLQSAEAAKRIYENSYFSFFESTMCPSAKSPLTDKSFGKINDFKVDPQKRMFSVFYETEFADLCAAPEKPTPMKVIDVFLEEPNHHFYLGAHTRFILLRYASTFDKFESGLKPFQEMVSQFQWIH